MRWNAKVFADQGYVVVAPNPTGSTGFGTALTDAIQNNWGMLVSIPRSSDIYMYMLLRSS